MKKRKEANNWLFTIFVYSVGLFIVEFLMGVLDLDLLIVSILSGLGVWRTI